MCNFFYNVGIVNFRGLLKKISEHLNLFFKQSHKKVYMFPKCPTSIFKIKLLGFKPRRNKRKKSLIDTSLCKSSHFAGSNGKFDKNKQQFAQNVTRFVITLLLALCLKISKAFITNLKKICTHFARLLQL